jgi:hypothetical protein
MHTNFGIFLRKLEIYLLHLNYDAFRSECLSDVTVSNITLLLRVITMTKMLKNLM